MITMMLAQAVTLPILWAEPVFPGRAVDRNGAIGLCATRDAAAEVGMDETIGSGRPGPCSAIDGMWRVERKVADRCIGRESAYTIDARGRRHPAVSCRVEAHAVLIAQGAARRYAVIVMTAEQLD